MELTQFVTSTNLVDRTQTEKVIRLAYYNLKLKGLSEFSVADVQSWFGQCHFASPNVTRLKENLAKCPSVVKGSKDGMYRLHVKALIKFGAEMPGLGSQDEEIVGGSPILPEGVFLKTRGYVEALARQINACYEHNIFDGCAVLMRRLLEVLLILSYDHLGISTAIQDTDGNYRMLEAIVDDAKSNKTLALSRNTKAMLEDFRKLGNFSAHKIYYNCRRTDIDRVMLDYRAAIEELLYKAGVRV